MQSPAKLRHMKQLALDRIARYEREIGLIRQEIEVYDHAIGDIERLHGVSKRSNIVGNMQLETTEKSRSTKISAGRSRIESASRNDAVAADLSDLDIAEIVGASRQAVQRWHAGLTPIPERHAKTLATLPPKNGKPRAIRRESWKRIGK